MLVHNGVPEWLNVLLHNGVPEWLNLLLHKSVPEWLNVFIIIACQSGSMYQCIMAERARMAQCNSVPQCISA